MFLSATILTLYPLHNMATARRVPLPCSTYLYWEKRRRLERAREKKSNNSGKKSLYSYTDKEDHDIIQMFLLFMPVIYFSI